MHEAAWSTRAMRHAHAGLARVSKGGGGGGVLLEPGLHLDAGLDREQLREGDTPVAVEVVGQDARAVESHLFHVLVQLGGQREALAPRYWRI